MTGEEGGGVPHAKRKKRGKKDLQVKKPRLIELTSTKGKGEKEKRERSPEW